MKKYLISPEKNQYKANLHCHSVLSDGCKTPEELKEMYKSRGYSILAITDHERPTEHQSLADDNFILLTGYEVYIRPEPKYNLYRDEVHLNLFAKDPYNLSWICFNEEYSRYALRDGVAHLIPKVGSQRPREYTVDYLNEFIKVANDAGYLVAYNHHAWSMLSEAMLLDLKGLFSLEISNYSSYIINGMDNYNGAIYNRLLANGERIFCHGGDDNHNKMPQDHPHSDSFGAFTMIMPDSLNYSSVINAMENGEMYSSMGPTISELSIDGKALHLECSEVSHVYVYFSNKAVRFLHASEGEAITSFDCEIDKKAPFVRVAICDKNGNWASTRGYFADELK